MPQPPSPGLPELPPYPPPPPDAGLNGFAVVSLVLGLCGGVLFSVVFGIVALVQMRSRPYRGKGMAIGGLALSGVWVVGFALLVVIALLPEADRDASGAVTQGGRVSVDELRAGDCVNDLKEGRRITSVPAVPCGDPHEGEVVAVFSLPAGVWPGEEQIAEQAEQGCLDHFATYAPSADVDSFDIFYFHPIERSWRMGDRKVMCIAVDFEETRTGSLRG